MAKIVILDAFTANPGDLNWNQLRALGDCEIHDRTPADQVTDRARDAEVILTNKVVVNAQTIRMLPKLKYIGVLATGYNVVDIEAAKQGGVVVTNVPAYSTASVAQATFALLLELTNAVGRHDRRVHEGGWVSAKDFCFWDGTLTELDGLTMGIVGFGTIGRAVAKIANAFGMKVLATTRTGTAPDGVQTADLETLLSRSDVVSLHCPLTDATRHYINSERLARMKRSALLINTSRGPLIDEAALAVALNESLIAGAGLDVLSTEPPVADNPLLHAKNCVITPHVAWATQSALKRLVATAIDNVRAFLAGESRNVVNR